MSSEQLPEKIKEVATNLDIALEKKDYESILSYFAEDCEIEFLQVILKGRKGVKKWLDYIFEHVKSIKFKPILIMVENATFLKSSMSLQRCLIIQKLNQNGLRY
jgi:ketosteroid isomerase-like protein